MKYPIQMRTTQKLLVLISILVNQCFKKNHVLNNSHGCIRTKKGEENRFLTIRLKKKTNP